MVVAGERACGRVDERNYILFVCFLLGETLYLDLCKKPTIFFECEAVTRLYDSVDAEIAILS